MENKEINIVLACDSKFLSHFFVTAMSIINNKSYNDCINFHLFFDGDCCSPKLGEIKDYFLNSNINLNVYFPTIDDIKNAKVDNNIPISAYFRLLISKYIHNIERVIYLDCDVIVTSSLRELFNVDLLGNVIAAVKDAGVTEKVKNKLGVKQYFNSGVLVIDLNGYNENIKSCINMINNHD